MTSVESFESFLEQKLPHAWEVYLYQKSEFKKMDKDVKIKPYTEILRFDTLGQFIYLMKMFEEVADHRTGMKKIDKGHFIFMKEGIKPLWEDDNNINGGTYSLKINHDIGFKVFRDFMFYIIGNTLNNDMKHMNGISISCIPCQSNKSFNSKNYYSTYIKIWNGNPNNNMANINTIIPKSILDIVKPENFMYQVNESKTDFNTKTIKKITIKQYEVKNDVKNDIKNENKKYYNNKYNNYDDDGFISVKKKNK